MAGWPSSSNALTLEPGGSVPNMLARRLWTLPALEQIRNNHCNWHGMTGDKACTAISRGGQAVTSTSNKHDSHFISDPYCLRLSSRVHSPSALRATFLRDCMIPHRASDGLWPLRVDARPLTEEHCLSFNEDYWDAQCIRVMEDIRSVGGRAKCCDQIKL